MVVEWAPINVSAQQVTVNVIFFVERTFVQITTNTVTVTVVAWVEWTRILGQTYIV